MCYCARLDTVSLEGRLAVAQQQDTLIAVATAEGTTTSFMDCNVETKKFPTLGDLPVCCHTTRYERFFLLSLDLRVKGEKAKFSGINSSRLYLSDPQKQSLEISCESLLTWADAAGKDYGIGRVARLCCGELPMMEVDFPSKNAIATLLKSLQERKFQVRLETPLKKRMKSDSSSSVKLYVRLFLAIPLGEGDVSLREVTQSNLESCMKTLKEGNKFDYRNIMSEDQLLPHKRSTSRFMCCISETLV